MSRRDDFSLILSSNVASNPANKPNLWETQLASPLELEGDWKVAVMSLSYPHNWKNLDKPYTIALLVPPQTNVPELTLFEREEADLVASLKTVWPAAVPGGEPPTPSNTPLHLRRIMQLQAGHYDVETILKTIRAELKDIYSQFTGEFTFNKVTQTVEVRSNCRIMMACYTDNSIFQILGLGKSRQKLRLPGKRETEYLSLASTVYYESIAVPALKRITNMFIYSDIVELTATGDTQAATLGFLPLQSKFNETGYWSFNPPYFTRVKEKFIPRITIKLCTETGEPFPIVDGRVILHLFFRRIPFF